ncbi:DUF2079 domain-containing protein [Kitasatospora cineracea]|uniref:Putative membrane protein n=1 Tax=Kitasatospora cineracea TaxID=88074 RepID=A0A8G1UNE6_9ACTN|nr:DUF2079 domain-containing protein [Kitasatospora cineracea]ROR47010.1 putative membrane protein [Kitasatospora cineracea]
MTTRTPLTHPRPAAAPARPPHPPRNRRGAATALGSAFLLAYLTLSLRRYDHFGSGVDLAIFGQAVKHLAAGQAPVVDLKAPGFLAFGDHFDPIIALAAPFYRIWPDTRVLLCIQALLVAVAVVIIADIATTALGRWRGLSAAAAFGTSVGVQNAVDFDFHEIAFAAPLLALALRAHLLGRWRQCAALTAGLLLVKEDSAFIMLGIAIALAIRGRRALAAGLAAWAVVGLAIVLAIVIPSLSYWHRYTYAPQAKGPWTFFTAGAHSLGTSLVTDGTASRTLVLLLAGAGVIGARSPLIWAVLIPFLARAANTNPAYWGPGFHYNLLIEVALFAALVDALRHRSRAEPVVWALIAWMTAAALACGPLATVISSHDDCSRCRAAHTALAVIPDGATVAADTYLLPHLVDHTTGYLLTPEFTDSTGHPLTPDWVVLDEQTSTYGDPSWVPALTRRLASIYEEVSARDGYVVLHRRVALLVISE